VTLSDVMYNSVTKTVVIITEKSGTTEVQKGGGPEKK
jgi:hypothetical protein